MIYSLQNKKKKLQQLFYEKKDSSQISTKKQKVPFVANPFGDVLTRIRNGCLAKKKEVSIIYSKQNLEFLNVLLRENLIQNVTLKPIVNKTKFKIINSKTHALIVELKYLNTGEARIKKIVQVSTFSRRISCRLNNIQKNTTTKNKLLKPKNIRFLPQNEYTIWILNTSQGILSEKEAIKQNIGGEILCWIL